MRYYDYIFIGAGSGNLFPILHLMDVEPDATIAVVDMGFEPKKRRGILFGFAGAGLKSDGKMVFSMHDDRSGLSRSDKTKGHAIIMGIIDRYTQGLDIGNSHESYIGDISLLRDMHDNELSLRQSNVTHIGTDNNFIMAERMYQDMIKHGIDFYWGYKFDGNIVADGVEISNTDFDNSGSIWLQFGHLQLSLGKAGSDTVDKMINNNIALKKYMSASANIGVRMEFPMNNRIERLASYQYDYKLYHTINGNLSMRTFCTNNYSAYVIKEPFMFNSGGRIVTFNGHAFGKNSYKVNDMSNTALIMRIDEIEDVNGFTQKILASMHPNGSYVIGDNFNGRSTIDYKKLYKYRNISDVSPYPKYIIEGINDFIQRINSFLQLDNDWIAYIPEIKMASGKLETNENYIVDDYNKHVSFVGDCTSGAIGIVPSGVTGLKGLKLI